MQSLSLLALGAFASLAAAAPANAQCCGSPCGNPCGYSYASPCGGYGYGYGYGYGGCGYVRQQPWYGTQYYIVNEGPIYSGPGIVTMPPHYPYVGPSYEMPQYAPQYEVAPAPRMHYRKHVRYHRRVEPVERVREDGWRPTKERPFDPRDK